MSLGITPIRIFGDTAGATASPSVLDLQTGAEPNFRQGDDARIQFAIGAAGEVATSISNLASVTCEFLSGPGGSVVLTQTITSGFLNPALAPANWANGTDQHCIFAFTAAQTATFGLVAGQGALPFWLKIFCTTSDSPAEIITAAEGEIIVSL